MHEGIDFPLNSQSMFWGIGDEPETILWIDMPSDAVIDHDAMSCGAVTLVRNRMFCGETFTTGVSRVTTGCKISHVSEVISTLRFS